MKESQANQSRYPSEMLSVIPPQGTRLYNPKNGDFGLKYLLHGRIRTFDETPGSNAELTDGTLLIFNPGGFKAHVTKRGLTEKDINGIGDLCRELDSQFIILDFLPKAIKDSGKLAKNLMRNKLDSYANMPDQIKSLGVLIDTLEENNTTQREYLHELFYQLDICGVTLVESETQSTRDGTTPIRLAIPKDKRTPIDR